MYVCKYVYTYICIYIKAIITHMAIIEGLGPRRRAPPQKSLWIFDGAFQPKFTCVNIYIYIYIYIHTYTHMYTYIYMHTGV